MNADLRKFLVACTISLTVLCVVSCVVLAGIGYFSTHPATETETTVESTVAPTNTPLPTAMPTKEVAATPTLAPQPIVCTTPSIKTSLDGTAFAEHGEYLKTYLGERMTRTTRLDVFPDIAWDTPLSADQLKKVEQTWVYYQVCVPEGMSGRIFAGGFEQGLNRYENGVLLSLKPGLYEFRLRNGEAVIWYPGQETFASKDLERIFDQIRHGNFDIRAQLAFFGVTTDLLPLVPQDLVKLDNVQIVPNVEPVVR